LPKETINDVGIFYEISGEGHPLVFCHEFAGNSESWNNQMHHFSNHYKVITYNARGYPPSDVPDSLEEYSEEKALHDLRGLLLHLNLEDAFVVGLSMGGNTALNLGSYYPEMLRGLVIAGTGTGSDEPLQFRKDVNELADKFEIQGMMVMAENYANSPTRLPLKNKNIQKWKEFRNALASHSSIGSALTFRGIQGQRPTIYQRTTQLRNLMIPTLIICGDSDTPCINPSVFMKQNIPKAGLAMFPLTGHTLNVEEPMLFNSTLANFMTAVESDTWL